MAKKRLNSDYYRKEGWANDDVKNYNSTLKSLQNKVEKSLYAPSSDDSVIDNLIVRKQQEDEQKQQVLNDITEEHEKELYTPTSNIEDAVSKTNPEGYKNYKDNKTKIDELESKDYMHNLSKTYSEATAGTTFFGDKSDKVGYLSEAITGGVLTVLDKGENLLKYGADWLTAAVNDGGFKVEYNKSGLSKNEKEYLDLLKRQVRQEELPAKKQYLKELKSKYDVISKKMEPDNYGPITLADGNLVSTMNLYEQQIDDLQTDIDYTEEKGGKVSNVFKGFFGDTGSKIKSLVSLGTITALDHWNFKEVMQKKNSGQQLTDAEEELLQSGGYQNETQKLNLNKDNTSFKLGQTLETSTELGAGMGITSAFTKTAKAAAIASVEASIKNSLLQSVAKTGVALADVSAQSLITPITYDNYSQKMTGGVVLTKDDKGNNVLLTSKEQKKSFEADAKKEEYRIKEQIQRLEKSPETNKEKLNSLYKMLYDNQDNLSKVYDETGNIPNDVEPLHAAIYAGTESLKEIGSELYVGHLFGKGYNKLDNYLIGKPGGRIMKRLNNISEYLPSLNNTKIGKVVQKLGYHTNYDDVFQSVPEEFMEEIVTGLTPTYNAEKKNYNKEDYGQQIQQFKDPEFWFLTAASTIVQGGLTSSLQASNHYLKYTKDKNYKEFYDTQKKESSNIKDVISKIDSEITDDNLAKVITMNVPKTIFSIKDYESEVAKLRLEGKSSEAKSLEKNALYNLSINAFQNDDTNTLKKSMIGLTRNKDINSDTKLNAQHVLDNVIPSLEKHKELYSDNINYRDIINLKTNKDAIENKIEEIEGKKSEKELEISKLITQLKNTGKIETNLTTQDLIPSNEQLIEGEDNTAKDKDLQTLFEQNPNLLLDYVQHEQFSNLLNERLLSVNKEYNYETSPSNYKDIKRNIQQEKKQKLTTNINKATNIEDIQSQVKDINSDLKENEKLGNVIFSDGEKKVQILNSDNEVVKTIPITQDNKELEIAASKINEIEVKENLGVNPVDSIPKPESIVESSEAPEVADDNLLNLILSQNEQAPDDVLDEPTFSRRSTGNVSTSLKQLTQTVADRLDEQLDKKANLKDFIESRIRKHTYAQVEDLFNVFTDAWQAIGRDVSNRDEVYESLFNVDDALLNEALNHIDNSSEQEVVEAVKKQEYQLQEDTAKKNKFDLNGKAQSVDIDTFQSEDRRTANAGLKAAFNLQDSKRIDDVTWTVLNRELKTNDLVDNHFILDYSFIKPGMKLKVVQMDLDDIPMTEYLSDGTALNTTWGLYKIKNKGKLVEGNDLWAAKVPMVATYTADEKSNPVPLFMIHEPSWYNERNISDREGVEKQQAIADEGFNNAKELRKQIIAGNNEIEISSTHFGSLDKTNNHIDKTPLTISQATGESTIGIVKKQGNLYVIETSKGKVFKGATNVDINQLDENGNPMFANGTVVDLRVAMENSNGEPVHMVLHTMNNSPVATDNLKADLDERVFNNIKYGVLSSIILNNSDNSELRKQIEDKYNFTLGKAEELKKQVQKDTGINISTNIADYTGLFVQMGKTNETLDRVANNSFHKTGITYFDNKYLDNKTGQWKSIPNAIQVLHKGEFKPNEENYSGQTGIGNRITEVAGRDAVGITMSNFDKLFHPERGIVKKSQFAVNLGTLGKDDILISNVNEKGEIIPGAKTYNDTVKDNLRTNIISHKIKTIEGKDKWVLDVQPMIYFESLKSKSNFELPPYNGYDIVGNSNSSLDKAAQAASNAAQNIAKQEFGSIIEEAKSNLSESEQDFLNSMLDNFNIDNTFNSRWNVNEEQQEAIQAIKSNKIKGLSNLENLQLVSSLKNLIISSIDYNKKVYIKTIKDALATSLQDHLVPVYNTNKSILANLSNLPEEKRMVQNERGQSLQDVILKLQSNIETMDTILEQGDKLISTKKDNLGSITKELNTLFGTNLEEEDIEENEDSFSKSFLEKELKLSYSVGLRLSLFGVPTLNSNKNQVTGFLNLPKYHNVDDVINILLDITSTMNSNWDTLVSRLNAAYEDRGLPIYQQLKNKLNVLPDYLKNELLYKSIAKKLTIYKILNSPIYGYNSKGQQIITGYDLSVLDENSSKEDMRLRNSIKDGFISSSFGQTDDAGDIILNRQYTENAQKALSKYTLDNGKSANETKVREIFNHFGLGVFNDNTIKEYLKGNNPFEKNTGILWFVNQKLNDLIKADKDKKDGKKILLTEKTNNLFNNANSALDKLVQLEVMLNGSFVSNSIRVAGKTMQGVIANTSMYDITQELKDFENSDLFKALKNNALTKNNTIIELLENDAKFNQAFSVGFSSPDSYKVHGKNNFGDTDFDKIAEQDNIATTFALYTNTKGNPTLSDPNFKKGLSFRIGQLNIPTLSDKGRMVYLTTALLDLKSDNITFDGDTVALDDNVLSYLSEQLFESDLNRIVQSYKNGKTNIKEYDVASKIFTSLPSLNSIDYKGKNIHEYLRDPDFEKASPEVMQELRTQVKAKVAAYVNSELNSKINSKGTEGQFVQFDMYDNTVEDEKESGIRVKNIDTEYLNSKPGETSLDKLRYVTTEFIINNILNLNNIHQVYLGDIAYYSKAGKISGMAFNTDGTIDTSKISDPKVYGSILEGIGVIINKRAASLIAPGLKLANSDNKLYKNNTHYMHIAVNDVESMSSVIRELVESQYGKFENEASKALDEVLSIDEKINSTQDSNEIKGLEKRKKVLIETHLSELKDYFNITGTDAQEYTTWKAHIDTLYRQGKLTDEDERIISSAYEKLSNGQEVNAEELKTLMQPIKPVYTGLVPEGNLIRPVYIKSSSFPLLPQVTKNLKIDEVRKKLETLEERSGTVVRMSYQTANKIGARNTKLSMEDLYSKDINELYTEDNTGLLNSAISVLPTKNFKVQQETPSKEEKAYKKGKDSYITMGSQFFKVITGNGINHITEKIFPNLFSQDILDMSGVSPVKGKLSGQDLDKIYKSIYSEYSQTLKDDLYSELGLNDRRSFEQLSEPQQNEIITNLQRIIKKEIVERGYPNYLEESVRLVEEAGILKTEMPLMFDANSHKFESLLLAIVSSRLINHKLPGNSHISASSEGFERITNLEAISEKTRNGIVWLGDRGPGELKSTINKDGQIVESEVLIKSHYKVRYVNGQDEQGNDTYGFKYIDLQSDEYSEPIITDGKIIGRKLKQDKIDEQLLSQFSFRIPTSSHQSGVVLKVAGFLPTEAGDLLLVPKEHTVQLGEDYDIDKRYVYKSNYYVDSKTGSIKKLQYEENVKASIKTINSILTQEDIKSDKLVSALIQSNLVDEAQELRDEIVDMGVNANSEGLIKVGKKALNKLKLKMLENSLIDIYKSVYQSPSDEIQRKIFRPLVTDTAEETSSLMDKYLSTDKDYTNFSILSDNYQRYLLKLGADGKGGIGVHSNAVTLEAQLQKIDNDNKVRIVDHYDLETQAPIYFDETIGRGLTSEGWLGKSYKTLDGGRDVADQHGENQNVSTDNINKQIMGKRNENTHTMSVYAFMAHLGFDLTLDKVNTGIGESTKLHVPSLLMNQPVIRDYVELKEKYSSITAGFSKDTDSKILEELGKRYNFVSLKNQFGVYSLTNFMEGNVYSEASNEMTGQKLWDNLKKDNVSSNIQSAALQKFFRFQAKALELSQYQQLINLSTSELGISYFEVMQRIETLNNLGRTNSFENSNNLVGNAISDYEYLELPMEERKEYTKVGEFYWKPNTIEGTMLINSLKSAQDVLPIFFPYEAKAYQDVVNRIFTVKDIDPNKKSSSVLKLKYEIMSNLNDFISSDTGIFQGNANNERARLFKDTDTNKSLAKILKELKESRHPIMNNLLLKDFKFEINKDGSGISLISHLASNSTSFDKISKYESFNELLQSDEVLGEFNGETLTSQKLAQDLASYAYLADNENGATGFRNFISVDYLKVLQSTDKFRNMFDKIKDGQENTLMDNFVTQFFQHNPDRAYTLNPNNQVDKGFVAIKGELTKANTLEEFRLENETPEFVSVRDGSIKTSNKKYILFKYNEDSDSYKRIDVLGTRGYNEYNSNNPVQTTIVKNNVFKKGTFKIDNIGGVRSYINKDTRLRTKLPSVNELLPSSLGLEGILQKIYDSEKTSQEYKNFINELKDYVKLDVKFEYAPMSNGTFGQYNRDTNTITISSTIVEDALLQTNGSFNDAINIVKEVIFEEIIHSMTVNEIKKYIQSEDKTTGKVTLIENAPLFANKLVALYEAARQEVPYDERDISTYYSKDIYEFIAGVFVSPDYRAKLEEKQEGFIDRFKKMLRDLFGIFYNNSTGKTLKYNDEIFGAIKDLLKTEKEISPDNKGIELKEAKPTLQEVIQEDRVEVPEVEVQRVEPIKDSNNIELNLGDFKFSNSKLENFILANGEEVKGYKININNQPNVDLFVYKEPKIGWSVIENKSKMLLPLDGFFNKSAGSKSEIFESLMNTINKKSKQEQSKKVLESIGFNFNKIEPIKEQDMNVDSIYNQLGNKTVNGNVIIKSVYQQEGINYVKSIGGVFSLRVNNSDKHFGNPFSSVPSEIAKDLTPTKSTKESVEKYIDWVINSQDSRAQWIREQLQSGILKDKPIVYYKELGEPSHATALDYLINQYEWNKEEPLGFDFTSGGDSYDSRRNNFRLPKIKKC